MKHHLALLAPVLAFAPTACSQSEPAPVPQPVEATCTNAQGTHEFGFNPSNGRAFFTQRQGSNSQTTLIEATGRESINRVGEYKADVNPGAPVPPLRPANAATNLAAYDRYQAAKAEYTREKAAWDVSARERAAAYAAMPRTEKINRAAVNFSHLCGNSRVNGAAVNEVRIRAIRFTPPQP